MSDPTHRALPNGRDLPAPLQPARLEADFHRFPESEAHFWDYWTMLKRRRATVALVFLGAVLTAFVWSVTARPVFTGTAMLRIEKDEPRILKFEPPRRDDSGGDSTQTQLQTERRLLQRRALANRVIALVDLGRHPEFRSVGSRPGELTEAFLDRLEVETVRNTRLVKVSFESRSPELAAQVANTLADAVIAQQFDDKKDASQYATRFLTAQVNEARQALQSSEVQLSQFLEENGILFVTERVGERAGERQALISQELATLSDSLLKAKAERIAKESMLTQATRATADSLPAVLQDPLIAHLKEEATKLEGRYRELGQSFKPEYPRMQRLAENIQEVRRQIHAEIQRFVEAARAEYRAALQKEIEIRKLADEQRGLARKLDGQMARYNLLRREVDTNRELYTGLSTRLKETQVSSSLLLSNISVVDRADVPLKRSSPRTGLNLLVGCLVGLVGGVGLAFLFEYLDTNIRDPREVEAILRVPTLGLVPTRSALPAHLGPPLGPGDGAPGAFALVAHQATSSILAEAFRNLRTSVVYATPDRPPKTMLVTSLQQQDGKTSVSTNCAISLAQLGMGDVLLVDADMRHPDLHGILGVPQTPGLSDLLVGGVGATEVVRPTRIPGLFVIPAGPVPANPSELLYSPRFTQALAVLGERFAHIVIDTPPLLGVADTLVLAPRVEGVILVLRHGHAARDAAQRAVQMLGSVRARLLGVVLNHADARRTPGGYQYYRQEPFPSGASMQADWTTRDRSAS